ncbi:hypothetical protein EOD42_14215 [Rhodovarius crocodyli]|uniref:Uncharacterized protein n=1 Tax=Rhodovarius crocodyli TaxID=1979269 RepID=A0A437MF55_9PROT|nr:hypothetical protein [Rhodovarius crocodyli]RVT96263.1 hypothetical protein EOD42_14215 [Rhodovarius crocodyli]
MNPELTGVLLWAVRMGLVALGSALAAHGVGDKDLWEQVATQVAGPAVAMIGIVLSYRARKKQIAAPPPPRVREWRE